jgi:serine protease Do
MDFYNNNQDPINEENNSQQENSVERDYNYSWNTQEPIFTEQPKRKKPSPLRVFAGAFALILGISVISLAVYGGYNMLSGKNGGDLSTNGGDAPTMEITNIKKEEESEPKEGELLTTTQAIAKVKPSVVGIVSNVVSNGMSGTSTGTGIIMTEDGYIITNAHVIEGATSTKVVFEDQSEETATIIGSDSKSDLAVLKINKTGLTAAEFGSSDDLQVGESVVAIGNPLGLELYGTAVDGIISATNREVTIEDRVMTLIQTTAPINEGNSGGPLINMYGQVIGINSAKISGTGVEGISFAIPISHAKPIIDDLIQNGYVKDRPLIGISGSDVSQQMSQFYDIPQGVLVDSVTSGGPAEAAGIRSGDIIVKVDGVVVQSMSELNAQKDKHKAGDTVELTVYRDGKTYTTKVTMAEDKPTDNG